jgi:hypothetical protein
MMPSMPMKPGEVALLESERVELETQLRKTRAAARRHTLWGLLGASPGAVIPLIVTANHFGLVGVAAFSVVLAGVELWRGSRLFNAAAGLESRLQETSEAVEAARQSDATGDVASSERAGRAVDRGGP